MAADVARAKKRSHLAKYETAMCHTHLYVRPCVIARVCTCVHASARVCMLLRMKTPNRVVFNLKGGGGELGLRCYFNFIDSKCLFNMIRYLITPFFFTQCTKDYYTGWGT